MRIALAFDGSVPPSGYGGVERVVYWLAREFLERGHELTLIAQARSPARNEFDEVRFIDFELFRQDPRMLSSADVDMLHFHDGIVDGFDSDIPYLVTEHGNDKTRSDYARNTVFLSRSHAQNHGAEYFVRNGVPLDEYPFSVDKDWSLLYLAKLNWGVKNARTAIDLALDCRMPLALTGGKLRESRKVWGTWLWRYRHRPDLIRQFGTVDGMEKLALLQRSRILFYLVNWHEPFALAPHEALACGTPVLASPNGALPEYVSHGNNGFIVSSYAQAKQTLLALKHDPPERIAGMARACRASAADIRTCATDYLAMYERIQKEGFLYTEAEARSLRCRPPPSVRVSRRPW